MRRAGLAVIAVAAAAAGFAPAAEAKVFFDMRGAVLRWDQRVSETVPGCPGNRSCGIAVEGTKVYLRRVPAGSGRRMRLVGRIAASGTLRFRVPHVSPGRYSLAGRIKADPKRRLLRFSDTFRITARATGAAAGCPVTAPNGSTPPGERATPQHHGNGLWTVLPPDGRLVVVPPPAREVTPHVAVERIEPDGSIAIKFPWWGDARAGARLTITGRRLDGPAPRLRAEITRGSTGAPRFWATGLRFPRSGCWRVTGRSGTARLTFVLQFVDRVTDRSARARSRPTPASRGCRVTKPNRRPGPRGAPVDTNHGVAGLWASLPHRGVLVAVRVGRRLTPDTVVVRGTPPPADGAIPLHFLWVRNGRRHVRITGRRLDAAGSLRSSTARITDTGTRIRFPSAGCWRLTARAGSARMTFVVFLIDELR